MLGINKRHTWKRAPWTGSNLPFSCLLQNFFSSAAYFPCFYQASSILVWSHPSPQASGSMAYTVGMFSSSERGLQCWAGCPQCSTSWAAALLKLCVPFCRVSPLRSRGTRTGWICPLPQRSGFQLHGEPLPSCQGTEPARQQLSTRDLRSSSTKPLFQASRCW